MTASFPFIALDMEGVLVPEIWVNVAKLTGIEALKRTTRDEPDYNKLMAYRRDILDREGITLPKIQQVIGTLEPLPGARAFLDQLRSCYQVAIVSDTFQQFAGPLMEKLGWPTLLCNTLEVTDTGRIAGWRLRQPDQKRHAIEAFKALQYQFVAAGDFCRTANDHPVLGAILVLLQAQAGFGLDLDALDLEAPSFIDAVVPTPRAVHFAVQRVLFAFGVLQLGDDVFDVLAAGFFGDQNGIGCFHHDQVFYTHQAD
jgi:phosphoserine/homoserine phosphotransferase